MNSSTFVALLLFLCNLYCSSFGKTNKQTNKQTAPTRRPPLSPPSPLEPNQPSPLSPLPGDASPATTSISTTTPTNASVTSATSSSTTSPPTPGAYAMRGPAPDYVLEGEEEEEEEEEQTIFDPYDMEALPSTAYPAPALQVQEPPPPEPLLVLDANVTVVYDYEDGEATTALQQENKDEEDGNEKAGLKDACCARKLTVVSSILLVVAAVAVILGIVLSSSSSSSSGGSGSGDDIPTPSPTLPPEEVQCIGTTLALKNKVLNKKANVPMDIQLCKRTPLIVKLILEPDKPEIGTHPPVLAASNTHVRCGEDGSLLDECIIRGDEFEGTTLLLSPERFNNQLAVTNVTFEGLAFEHGLDSMMELMNGGEVTFRNCLFRVRYCAVIVGHWKIFFLLTARSFT